MTSFTLIRNPLCRLQSCYEEKALMNKVFLTMKRSEYHNDVSLENFVEFNRNLALQEMNIHTQLQAFLIRDSKRKLPHVIARLARLDQEWNTFKALMRGRNEAEILISGEPCRGFTKAKILPAHNASAVDFHPPFNDTTNSPMAPTSSCPCSLKRRPDVVDAADHMRRSDPVHGSPAG